MDTDGVFYTDANGRQIIYRQKDHRPTYTYTNEEPQAGNYYPVNSKILIKDKTNEFAVLTDRSEGGSSLNSGELELMVLFFLEYQNVISIIDSFSTIFRHIFLSISSASPCYNKR